MKVLFEQDEIAMLCEYYVHNDLFEIMLRISEEKIKIYIYDH